MNKVVKWFEKWSPNTRRKLDVDAQNRKLLYDSLELCYCSKSISKVKDVLNHCAGSFTVGQRISFTSDLLYRERMIEYNTKKLKKAYYTSVEIEGLLENTTKHFQCNAILLHINRYREIYTEKGDNLSRYFGMVRDRKAFLLHNIEVIL